MYKFRWVLIIVGMVTGVFSPWQYQVVAFVALLMGYASCFAPRWSNFQLLLAYLYGGLATGLGLQIFIVQGSQNHYLLMLIQPLLLWLLLRIFFYALETRFTLRPNEVVTQMRSSAHSDEQQSYPLGRTSAWSGDTSSRASIPDSNGHYISYNFYCTGEIAMGGPTYGDVVFSNKCALSGVGPSIGLSEDGRYAAMTLPSRERWKMMIVDLLNKKVYLPKGTCEFWEIDAIKNEVIYGRYSPLTSNTSLESNIQELMSDSEAIDLVVDDGWWVIDYPNRQKFPSYEVVSINSKQGTHKVTFVPDLKQQQQNPFTRFQSPAYIVMVDEVLLGLEVDEPRAIWVDGLPYGKVYDGRFLVLKENIFDFRDEIHEVFDAKNPIKMKIESLDEMTHVAIGNVFDAGEAKLIVNTIVMPRSTGIEVADRESYSFVHPWDEEEVGYWNAVAEQKVQLRTRVQNHMQYLIDLPRYSFVQSMRLCTEIHIMNRALSENRAQLNLVKGSSVGNCYSAYTLTTSCGVTIQRVTHEAIWSHCGRYLAVVAYEAPPQVPYQILIIDFKTSTLKKIPSAYALPSFIWFDDQMLEFSYFIGVQETIICGGTKENKYELKKISDAAYVNNPYDLLLGGVPNRLKELEHFAQQQRKGNDYASASINKVSRHIILFAPDFDTPVMQPPADTNRR